MPVLTQRLKLWAVEAGLAAEAAWRWWLSEILWFVPARFARGGAIIAEFCGQNCSFIQDGKTIQPAEGSLVSLRISPDAVLRRNLRLPVSARFRLREILQNDLDRQSPINPREVLLTYRILAVDRAASRLIVSLVLIRRDAVEDATARLQSFGLRVQNIFAPDPEYGRDDVLAPPQRAAPKLARHHRLAALLALLALFLTGADVLVRAAQDQKIIASLAAQAAQLTQAATAVQAIRAQVEAGQDSAGFLATQRRAPSMGAILAEITNRLPDSTWLTGLTYDGHALQLQGFSANASNLVPVFDASKLFANAAFRAPMTQGPQPNLQQFDLSMDLAP
jgi:Tfp pilus assembly protein PilN